MKKIVVFLALQVILILSASAAAPKWISEPYSIYSRNEYIVAVGEGSSKLSAQNKALNGIATFFGQSVESKITASETFRKISTNENESNTSKSTLLKDIEVTVNQDDLLGIEYPEFFQDKKHNTWYVIGVMKISNACDLYTKKINDNEQAISALLNYDNKESLVYISRLRKALSISIENEKMNSRVFLMDSEREQRISKSSKIETELRFISEKLLIYVNIENDDGIVNSYCTELLKKQAFNLSNDEKSNYRMQGSVEYLYSESEDSSISFCEIRFKSQLIDTNSADIYAPLNITIREGSTTKELARNRALKTLQKKMNESFIF